MTRILVLTLTLIALSGCRIAVILVEGGEVQTTASGTCLIPPATLPNGTVCFYEVNDTNYAENFTAVADPGWEFVKWNSGGDFFCQDSTDATCVMSNVGSAGNSFIEAVIASDQPFYIMPVFERLHIFTNSVTVNEVEWAQVDLFTGVSWWTFNAVCPPPSGACSGNLSANGNTYDMTGWTWASGEEVYPFFNAYLTAGTGTMEENVGAVDTLEPIYDALLAGGMRNMYTNESERLIGGFLRTDNSSGPEYGDVAAALGNAFNTDMDFFSVHGSAPKDNDGSNGVSPAGAWFYR